MDSNQSLAKIGVFVLLAINVGAYCYFWPRYRDATKIVTKAAGQEKEGVQLLAPKAHGEAKQVLPEPEPVPLAISNPPALPTERIAYPELRVGSNPPSEAILKVFEQPPTDAALKLVEHIDSDKLPDLPTLPAAESARREAPPRIEPPSVIPALPRDPDPGIAVASPLTPKMPPGLWRLQSEKIGNRTHLTARLRDAAGERVVVEFRIQCDRVEPNLQTGKIQALGNINFTGAGWRGTCQTLTLPVDEPRLVFEGEVRISQEVLGSSQDGGLRGERIVWELPAPTSAGLSGVTLPLSR